MRLAKIEGGSVINAVEVDPDSIPDWARDWPELTAGADIGWRWDGRAFSAPPGPPAEEVLAEARSAARVQVSAAIRAARAAMITDMPGQDMIYLAKEAEARAWIADRAPDPADYPLISAEVGITAPDAASLVQIWLNLATLWRAAAARLEALRMSAAAAIDAAETPEDVTAALSIITEETPDAQA